MVTHNSFTMTKPITSGELHPIQEVIPLALFLISTSMSTELGHICLILVQIVH
jgi:hypothetical protein